MEELRSYVKANSPWICIPLAVGGSLEAVRQRRSRMAPRGLLKVAVIAGALSDATIAKHSTGIILRACYVLYSSISKRAGATL